MPEPLHLIQRAVYYGDALFESIRVFEGRIPLLELHWKRLEKGLRLLGYEVPVHWSTEFFEEEILKISPFNARARLTVWRSPGGLYLPENNTPHFLITAREMDAPAYSWPEPGIRLGVCTQVRLPIDDFSSLKTLNAPRYVAASREAHLKGWDDGLILNAQNRICEATSSNVFWWANEQLCTIPLSDGCVAGVMRSVIFHLPGIVVLEKPVSGTELQAADEIFLTNAIRGIIPVRIFADRSLKCERTRTVFEKLGL